MKKRKKKKGKKNRIEVVEGVTEEDLVPEIKMIEVFPEDLEIEDLIEKEGLHHTKIFWNEKDQNRQLIMKKN